MARGSRKRALLVGTGALLLFGGWALFANREHATSDMIRAAIAQGSFSFASSTLSVLLLEYLYSLGSTPLRQTLFAMIGTPAILLGVMTIGHLLARTPNVVVTLLPSWLSGCTFAVVYTLNLRRMLAKTTTR